MISVKTLKELDGSGITEPVGFNRAAAVAKVRAALPSLKAAALAEFKLIDDLEDSSSFAEVAVREHAKPGQPARARVAITFSRFGDLALIWSDELNVDELRSTYGELARVLIAAGFVPVYPEDLASSYAGNHHAWRGHSWCDRFFGEP